MRTVKSIYLEITQNVDPKTKEQVPFDVTNIGTIDGDSFSKEDILNFYNQARFIVVGQLRQVQGARIFIESVPEVVETATQALSLQGSPPPQYIFSHPTGYLRHIGMMGPGDKPGFILPKNHKFDLVSGADPYYDTSKFAFAIEEPNGFHIYYSEAVGVGTFSIMYVKLGNHTLADVTTGTKIEEINPEYHHVIIQVAGALSLESGAVDPTALARSLLGGS
jgi:hypothetical protein